MGTAVAGTNSYAKAANLVGPIENGLKLLVGGIPGIGGPEGSSIPTTGVYRITFTYKETQEDDSDPKTTDCFLEFKPSGIDPGQGSLMAFACGYDKVLPEAVKEHITKIFPDYSEQGMAGSRDGFHCWGNVQRDDILNPQGSHVPIEDG